MTAQKMPAKPITKIETLFRLIRRKRGATLKELQTATGWQAHSVRAAISATLNKEKGLSVSRFNAGKRGWVYRLPPAIKTEADK